MEGAEKSQIIPNIIKNVYYWIFLFLWVNLIFFHFPSKNAYGDSKNAYGDSKKVKHLLIFWPKNLPVIIYFNKSFVQTPRPKTVLSFLELLGMFMMHGINILKWLYCNLFSLLRVRIFWFDGFPFASQKRSEIRF